MIVPVSGLVKEQAEAEGLDKIFVKAGFDWREPGCSMCLAMNPDKLAPGERCASTSNRNFEGRQGYKGRTHLVSPAMAAAAAIAGHFVDVREWKGRRDARTRRGSLQHLPEALRRSDGVARLRRAVATRNEREPRLRQRPELSEHGREAGGAAAQRDDSQRHVAVGKTPRGRFHENGRQRQQLVIGAGISADGIA